MRWVPQDASPSSRRWSGRSPTRSRPLLRHTYMGYYSRPDVRPHFGLSDRPTQPDGYVLAEDDPDRARGDADPGARAGAAAIDQAERLGNLA